MPKQVISDIAQQIKQLGQETANEIKNQPKEMGMRALEQFGFGGSSKGQAAQQKKMAEDQQAMLGKLQAQDKVRSLHQVAQLKKELEAEVQKWRQLRQQQLQQRRQQQLEEQQQQAAQGLSEAPIISTKRKRGMFGSAGRRVKSAQEQAQPELAGKRVGG